MLYQMMSNGEVHNGVIRVMHWWAIAMRSNAEQMQHGYMLIVITYNRRILMSDGDYEMRINLE